MSYEDKEVRDFCYALISRQNKVHAIFVAPWVITGWQVSRAMGPTIMFISEEFLNKVKVSLGVDRSIRLRKLKSWDITNLNHAPTTKFLND